MEIKGEGWAGVHVLRVTDLKLLIFSSLAENISRYLVFLDCTVLKKLVKYLVSSQSTTGIFIPMCQSSQSRNILILPCV